MIALARRRWLAAAVFGGAALIAAALVGASLLTGRSSGRVPVATAHDSLLDGIPQQGVVLGQPDAPVTLVEYADLQCPYCAQWSRDAFPAIVDEYVRSGKLRIVFRGLAFIGPESEHALRAALAAGRQGRLWNLVHALYENQGLENGGWVTDDLLERLGRLRGIDTNRMLAETGSEAVEQGVAAAAHAAQTAGIQGTPSFQVGPTGGPLLPLQIESLDAQAMRPALDGLLLR